jgi:hypothetical protein
MAVAERRLQPNAKLAMSPVGDALHESEVAVNGRNSRARGAGLRQQAWQAVQPEVDRQHAGADRVVKRAQGRPRRTIAEAVRAKGKKMPRGPN